MNKTYYVKNMAHTNKDYFVTFSALPEKTDFHKVLESKQEVRMMEMMLQNGKMSKWFKGKVTVTLLGSDISGEVEVPCCSYDKFSEFLKNKNDFKKLIKEATKKLEENIGSGGLT